MYNPSPFAEDRTDALHAFIRRHPLAVVVTSGADGPEAAHVPVVLHPDLGLKGVLRCHFARANNQWRRVESSPVLTIFQGVEHYISPSWYAAKQEHGKVVPTWNYAAVHVRGQAKLLDRDQLIEHLNALTNQNEAAFEKPWSVGDAPKDYVEAMCKAIVGIEISIDVIEGKWKVSQNRSESDRQGVVVGLNDVGTPASLAMAQLVNARGLK